MRVYVCSEDSEEGEGTEDKVWGGGSRRMCRPSGRMGAYPVWHGAAHGVQSRDMSRG